MFEDRAGHLWLGTRLNGLLELTFDEPSGRVATTTVHSSHNGLPHNWINALFESKDGELWAGTPVPGLGDEAFFLTAGLMPMLHVRKGDAAIVVEAQGASDVQLVAIARKALERLPR